jgi:predicted TIM-barrel fold metal-dependent hydrolase
MTDYRLISSDSHVTMPVDAWQEYLDPEFRDRAPKIVTTDEGDFEEFEGVRKPILTLNNLAGKKPEEFKLNVRKLDEQRSGAWDPAERIKDMDTDGVDAEVLYVGGPLASKDPELRLNSVRGYNRWLADFSSHAPDRLLGVAAIPIDTPERAVEEIRWASQQTGLASGYIPLFPSPDEDYGNERWNPMWEAFIDAGWPVGLHVGGRRPGTPVVNIFESAPRFMTRPQVRGRGGSDRLVFVLPVLLRPPVGEAPVLDQERAGRAAVALFPPAGVRHVHGGPGGSARA